MKKIVLSIFFLILVISDCFSQQFRWVQLPNSPRPDSLIDGRFEDVYFSNANTGYAIVYSGKIYKTIDGGANWSQCAPLINGNRSVGFFTPETGIIGTLDSSKILFRTTNGGTTWTDMMPTIQGNMPKGICGISIVDSNTAYASGRYRCPAGLIKTTNRGLNWISIPLDTSLIRSAVDCKFWSVDSGFVIGGYAGDNIYYNGKTSVLFTSNGGQTFERKYFSPPSRPHEWGWKIQFVTRELGYIAIQDHGGGYFLKTTDGGMNWVSSLISGQYNFEGIGFVNENTGWIGGWGTNNYMPTIETTNGGVSWHAAGWGYNVNRFRFLNDTLAYAVGTRIFKYIRQTTGVQQISTEIPEKFYLSQNYPNPFNPSTIINYQLAMNSFVQLKIYDVVGNELQTIVNEKQNAGSYSVDFNAASLPSGIYFYKLVTDKFSETKKMILVK